MARHSAAKRKAKKSTRAKNQSLKTKPHPSKESLEIKTHQQIPSEDSTTEQGDLEQLLDKALDLSSKNSKQGSAHESKLADRSVENSIIDLEEVEKDIQGISSDHPILQASHSATDTHCDLQKTETQLSEKSMKKQKAKQKAKRNQRNQKKKNEQDPAVSKPTHPSKKSSLLEPMPEDVDLPSVSKSNNVTSENFHEKIEVSAPTASAFKFDGYDPRLKCALTGCGRMTSCWDPKVIACPRCGPESYIRYCCKQHLYDDIQNHWAFACEKYPIAGPVDWNTVQQSQLPVRKFIPPTVHNNVERHRQAIYYALESSGDYFVFDDIENIEGGLDAFPSMQQYHLVRGTGKLYRKISLSDTEASISPQSEFFNLLSSCLQGGVADYDNCMRAFRSIRDQLFDDNDWTETILTYLCLQVGFEWGFPVPEIFMYVDEDSLIHLNQNRFALRGLDNIHGNQLRLH